MLLSGASRDNLFVSFAVLAPSALLLSAAPFAALCGCAFPAAPFGCALRLRFSAAPLRLRLYGCAFAAAFLLFFALFAFLKMAEANILSLQAPSTKKAYLRYVKLYEDFRGLEQHSETILLSFLVSQSSSKAPTSLWTMYSLIKKYLSLECSLELSSSKISDYLKTLGRQHKKKKAPAFLRDDLFRYLRTAPNTGPHLLRKLVLLAGFYAGLRSCEIVALFWENLVFTDEGILLTITFSKTDRAGVGSVKLLPKLSEPEICPVHYFTIYKDLVGDNSGRLFRTYQGNKFIKTPIGKNKISDMPKEIALFLKLENPNSYTGHSLRVTSATVMADEGANTLTLKRHGRWSSESVAEEYVRESKHNRGEAALMLAGASSVSTTVTRQANPSIVNVSTVFTNCVFQGTVNLSKDK